MKLWFNSLHNWISSVQRLWTVISKIKIQKKNLTNNNNYKLIYDYSKKLEIICFRRVVTSQ